MTEIPDNPLGLGKTEPLPPAPKPTAMRKHALAISGRGRLYDSCLEYICGECSSTGWIAVKAGLHSGTAYVPYTEFPCWKCKTPIVVQGPVQGTI